jgi:negative regulator of flagellin synthesis FlgM
MKITHNKVGQNLNLSDAAGKADKAEKANAKGKVGVDKSSKSAQVEPTSGDAAKVDLSTRAQDVKRIKELAMASPDIDQAKVDKFQKMIDAGKYKVDSKAIADRLVDEHLFSTEQSSNE